MILQYYMKVIYLFEKHYRQTQIKYYINIYVYSSALHGPVHIGPVWSGSIV